ncbi:hypothetical protein Tcan_00134 [Toxocara canis]|uniref:Uncharacterized protein n=1 Tax=Toxocara canis TaxID=6265 RepID=A0A0B2VAN7_TOXCA|nr:hypothetical protein Tcan_00134 [Toxocara canis]
MRRNQSELSPLPPLPSNRCGSRGKSTTNGDHQLCTANASKKYVPSSQVSHYGVHALCACGRRMLFNAPRPTAFRISLRFTFIVHSHHTNSAHWIRRRTDNTKRNIRATVSYVCPVHTMMGLMNC